MTDTHTPATGMNIEDTRGTDLSASFYAHFQTRKNDISATLENLKISGKVLGSSEVVSISSDIANLRRDLIEATPHLPAYDQGKCEQQLKILEESFLQMRAPGTKFVFKRNPIAAGSSGGGGNVTQSIRKPATTSNSPASTTVNANSISSPTSNLTLSSRTSENLNITCLLDSDKSIIDLPDTSDVTLVNLHNCFVNFFSPQKNSHTGLEISFRMTALHGRDLDRTILIASIDGSVLLHNIHNSVIILACRQFRIHDSTNTTVLLDVLSNPIIERSSNLRFGSFPEQLKFALSDTSVNSPSAQYSVQDFDWIKPTPSPNWSPINPPYHFVDKILSRNETQDVVSFLKDCID